MMNVKRISYGIVGLVFAMLLSQIVISRTKSSSDSEGSKAQITPSGNQQAMSGLYAIRHVRQGERTERLVDQTRKNIQVLKGLPESQLFRVMNYIGDSLAVKCSYCHVKSANNQFVWDSDDKPAKLAARRMMKMVMDLNKTNSADFSQGPVSCYTCHRGQPRPENVVPLPLTSSAHEDGGTFLEAPVVPAAGPAPEQILEKYVAAVGGRTAISKINSEVLRGTVERTQGRSGSVEIALRVPESFYLAGSIPQQGTFVQSYNGSTGWSSSPRGSGVLTATDLSLLRQQAENFDLLKIHEPFPKMSLAGVAIVGGQNAYVLESMLTPHIKQKLYFDKQTGLLLRKMLLTETLLMPTPEQFDYEDYRDLNGLKVPFTVRYSAVDTFNNATSRFSEIKFNAPVDDAIFKMPVVSATPKP